MTSDLYESFIPGSLVGTGMDNIWPKSHFQSIKPLKNYIFGKDVAVFCHLKRPFNKERKKVWFQRHIYLISRFVHFQLTLKYRFSTYPMIYIFSWITKTLHWSLSFLPMMASLYVVLVLSSVCSSLLLPSSMYLILSRTGVCWLCPPIHPTGWCSASQHFGVVPIQELLLAFCQFPAFIAIEENRIHGCLEGSGLDVPG